jgi:hypothetical protein
MNIQAWKNRSEEKDNSGCYVSVEVNSVRRRYQAEVWRRSRCDSTEDGGG